MITPEGRRIQVKALRFTDPRRSSVGSFSRTVVFHELAIFCFEYDMQVGEALLIDANQITVPTDGNTGLLTPAGRRLSLGPRLRAAAVTINGDHLIPGGGRDRDRSLGGKTAADTSRPQASECTT